MNLIHNIFIHLKEANNKKPDPKEYSAIVGKGSVIPVQIEAYFLALNKYVEEDATVLDVGFGLGYGLNILAIKAKEVSGVDIDKKVYDYCQGAILGRNPRLVSLNLYDGYNLPFLENHFDIVTCVDCIEHVEDYDRLIREMLRVSRQGVFISTPNRRAEYTQPNGSPENPWHLREWSFEELDEIIQKYGDIDWNCINGPFEGPFTISTVLTENTLALSPFISKSNKSEKKNFVHSAK